MVEYRRVKVGRLLDGMRVIESGLKPDELVIVNGLLRARPGSKVQPKAVASDIAARSSVSTGRSRRRQRRQNNDQLDRPAPKLAAGEDRRPAAQSSFAPALVFPRFPPGDWQRCFPDSSSTGRFWRRCLRFWSRFSGLVAVFMLPVAQYPEITPPTVQVDCNVSRRQCRKWWPTRWPRRSSSRSTAWRTCSTCRRSARNDGTYSLTVTFKVGTNLNMAQVLVQNRVALASPVLPDVVKQVGVTVKKRSPDLMLIINLVSPDGRYDLLYLSNYAMIQLHDALTRLEGVGDMIVLGQRDYSMRVWLDPDRLTSCITAGDVVESLREQNVQVAAGQIGQQPAAKGVDFQFTMSTLGRLDRARAVRQDHRQEGADGRIIRLRDVGRVELGAKNEDQQQLHGRNAFHGHRRFPVARLQRLGHRRTGQGEDARTEEAISPRAGLPHLLRHDSLHQRIDLGGVSARFSRPSCWWRSWCSYSCRIGVPR